MGRVLYFDDIGRAIGTLVNHYNSGEVVALMAQVVYKDGSFMTGIAGSLSYVEKLGLLEAAKDAVRASAMSGQGC